MNQTFLETVEETICEIRAFMRDEEYIPKYQRNQDLMFDVSVMETGRQCIDDLEDEIKKYELRQKQTAYINWYIEKHQPSLEEELTISDNLTQLFEKLVTWYQQEDEEQALSLTPFEKSVLSEDDDCRKRLLDCIYDTTLFLGENQKSISMEEAIQKRMHGNIIYDRILIAVVLLVKLWF